MNKVAKGFLFASAAAAVLIGFMILCASLYVESPGVQARLESALSEKLHLPVKLTQVRFSLLGDLKVSGLTIPAAPEGETGNGPRISQSNFLEAPEVSARIEWRPLLSRRLVVREFVILEPKIYWMQTAKDQWRLPRLKAPEKRTAAPSSEKSPAVPVDTADAKPKKQPREPKASIEFKVNAARIEDATFYFIDQAGRPVAVLEGVTVKSPEITGGEIRGTVTLRKMRLHDAVEIEEVTSPFTYAEGRLQLPGLNARLGGGSIRGAGEIAPAVEGAPFTLDLRVEGVDLNRLLTESGDGSVNRKVEGIAEGTLDLFGMAGRRKTTGGAGHFTIRGCRVQQCPFLQTLGQALQIDELNRLDLQRAMLDVRVGEGKVFVDRLLMESPNLTLSATGKSSFNGKLDLAAELQVAPKISRHLPAWVEANFQAVPESDRKAIRFAITGPVNRPETDLMRIMVGRKIEKQVMDVFQVFMGNGKAKKKKGEAKPELVPAPAPQSEPTQAETSATPEP